MATLENLPDVCLLNVAKYLTPTDLCSLMKVKERFCDICTDRAIAKKINFEGSYLLSEDDIRDYIGAAGHQVNRLGLNHCYWLSSKAVQWTIHNCKNLTHLDVIECRLKTSALVQQITSMRNLISLSFSIVSFSDIKKDVFTDAADTLKNLQRLHIYFTSRDLSIMVYLGEHATMMDYCDNLEELKISSAGMAIPELYRPIISNPNKHLKLKVMCITNNIHAGAQMLFYGTLSQLPNSQLQWKTLLMPNVNFAEFAKKAEFQQCLKNIQSLESLDVSGSKVNFPNNEVDLGRAHGLRHLCLASTLVTSEQLHHIATHCPHLTSLNLHGCNRVLVNNVNLKDASGLNALLTQCKKLQHFNLSGRHHHSNDISVLTEACSQLKGLKTLSLSSYMLATDNTGRKAPGKRIAAVGRSVHAGMAPKRRCLNHYASVSTPGGDAGCSTSQASPAIDLPPPPPPPVSLMDRIVTNNPLLERLEVIGVEFNSVIHKNKFINPKTFKYISCTDMRTLRGETLLPIARLQHLRSLTLCDLPGLLTGECLSTILDGCPRLQSLSLALFGSGLLSNNLSRALRHCKALRDLRLEQPYMQLNAMFFEAVGECSQLQRLCILAKESAYSRDHVLKMVDKCRQLILLQLYAGNTIQANKTLTSILKQKYFRSGVRPGATFSVFPLLADGVDEMATSVPAKHLDEFSRFYSRVAAYPPGYNV